MRYVEAGYVADELMARYGIEMDKWDIVRLSASCLKRIGAFALQRKLYVAQVDNFQVTMPHDAYKVRGVVRLSSPKFPISNILVTDGVYQPPQIFFVEEVQETLSTTTLILKGNYIPWLNGAEYIDYDDDFPILKFNENDVQVAIEYTGLAIDKEGCPMIPEDVWEACMMFCLFTNFQSAYLAGTVDERKMGNTERWKDTAIAQARSKMTMSALTTNEKDKLLDIMVSIDRKVYGIPS